MPDPLWLPDVLRAAGLQVREYPGWRDRGHGDFGSIWGVVCHHTGSFGETARGIAEHPALGLCSQLHLDRDGVFTVCGAGIAWHAGQGRFPGLPDNDANSRTIGIEAANDGGGTPGLAHRASWSDAQYDAYVRGVAAILRHINQPASHAIGHKEWAGMAQGKWDPGAMDMNLFRADVQAAIDGGTAATQEDDMPSADDIAKAVWSHRPTKLDGKTDATAGEMLAWGDHKTGKAIDQLGGPKTRDRKDDTVTGWDQLGGRSIVDALAVIGQTLGIPGFKTSGGEKK